MSSPTTEREVAQTKWAFCAHCDAIRIRASLLPSGKSADTDFVLIALLVYQLWRMMSRTSPSRVSETDSAVSVPACAGPLKLMCEPIRMTLEGTGSCQFDSVDSPPNLSWGLRISSILNSIALTIGGGIFLWRFEQRNQDSRSR